jgi:hypothetical protein
VVAAAAISGGNIARASLIASQRGGWQSTIAVVLCAAPAARYKRSWRCWRQRHAPPRWTWQTHRIGGACRFAFCARVASPLRLYAASTLGRARCALIAARAARCDMRINWLLRGEGINGMAKMVA